MKILVVAPHIFNENVSIFKKNRTGFAMIINKILLHFSKTNECYLFTRTISKAFVFDGVRYINHSFFSTIFSIFSFSFIKNFWWFFRPSRSLKDHFKNLYFSLNLSLLKRRIKKIKPDVIHIHGIFEETKQLVEFCVKKGIPFVLTLHGIINHESVKCSNTLKNDEVHVTRYISKQNGYISVISSGIKKFLVENYNVDPKKVFIICNPTDLFDTYKKSTEKFGVNTNKYNIIYVSNLSYNKNQSALLQAISLLLNEQREKIHIYFVGNFNKDYNIFKELETLKLSSYCTVCGFLSRSELASLYKQCNLNVLLSYTDGFGISIAEALSYGLPSLISYGVDSYNDFDKRFVRAVHPNDKEAVCRALLELMETQFDRKEIQKSCYKFSYDYIIKEYLNLFSFAKQKN